MCRAIDDAAFYTSNRCAVIRQQIIREIGEQHPALVDRVNERQNERDLTRREIPTSVEQIVESELLGRMIAIARFRESDRRLRESEARDEWDSDFSAYVTRVRDTITALEDEGETARGFTAPIATDVEVVAIEAPRTPPNGMAVNQPVVDGQTTEGTTNLGTAEPQLPLGRTEEQREEQVRRNRMQLELLRDSLMAFDGEVLDESLREWRREHEEAIRRMEQLVREEEDA